MMKKTPPAISAACYEICSLAEKQAQNIARDEWFTIKDEKLPNMFTKFFNHPMSRTVKRELYIAEGGKILYGDAT